jgi:uncharacterized membrane protein
MYVQPLMLFLHITSVVVWVGGMFFAYVCLRPAVVELLEPPQRLQLWRGVFARFFVWVSWAATLVATSGLLMFALHGSAKAPPGWHLMTSSGVIMIGIFIYVATGPFNVLKRALEAADWKTGAEALNRIRQMIGINLILGLLTTGFATLGRYLG